MSQGEEDGEEGKSEQSRERNSVYRGVKKQTKRGRRREKEGSDVGRRRSLCVVFLFLKIPPANFSLKIPVAK